MNLLPIECQNAFINEDLVEEIYMEQLLGFVA